MCLLLVTAVLGVVCLEVRNTNTRDKQIISSWLVPKYDPQTLLKLSICQVFVALYCTAVTLVFHVLAAGGCGVEGPSGWGGGAGGASRSGGDGTGGERSCARSGQVSCSGSGLGLGLGSIGRACLKAGEGGGVQGWAGGLGGRGGCAHAMHSVSLKTIDPRILTMPGRSTSGFCRPGRHHVHQARSAVRCSASRMEGELHPFKNHL